MPKTIHSGERKIVHNVLKYLSVRKAEGLATISLDNITDLVVNMTGSLLIIEANKRYNVHEESKRLYNVDLMTVLADFRRSPEYLAILEDKMADMQQRFADQLVHTVFYYKDEMGKRVEKILGPPTSMTPSAQETTSENVLRTIRYLGKPKRRMIGRRTGTNETNEKEFTEMDALVKFYHDMKEENLPSEDANKLRNEGYELSRIIVKTLIKNMGPSDDTDEKVTSNIETEYETETTTELNEHNKHKHMVSFDETQTFVEYKTTTAPPKIGDYGDYTTHHEGEVAKPS